MMLGAHVPGGGWLIFRLPPAKLAVHPRDAGGTRTSIALSSGGTLGLYQPLHPTALGLPPAS